ncbi:MAG TPA: Zn-dependent hydrolase [Phycisphaerae bacterium]|nr:Zn-dependent hydrolase [Phycisphaerae bacterium]HRW53200.1 Zn-dependent hydrolase [Phycisphaerae bacterium]
MRNIRTYAVALFSLFFLSIACGQPGGATQHKKTGNPMLDKYATVRLTTDMSKLQPHEREMIPHLIEAAQFMDDAFWIQAYGDRDALLAGISDKNLRRFAEINYGPWDRLDDNKPFIPGVGPKPKGANFYPANMSKEEFEGYCTIHPDKAKALSGLYTMVRRAANGRDLEAIPYSAFFREQMTGAAGKLKNAAELAKDPGLRQYLFMRALALLQNNYQPSDMQWMDMKSNTVDCVIGPIETYEDQMFGQKACFEAYVLVKDKEWSERLAKYALLLPGLQEGLPVPPQYKKETPGTDSDLNAYDVLYYAGDCNAGSKTIAINLPNDEEVQLKKGSRRLQLKNAMRAKYDQILLPIADELIAKDQRKHITFDAFFGNTMFHEVAHGLGIKDTINGRGTVRDALKEQSSALEEGKADILGLYMVTELRKQGEITDGDLMDNYVTFLAGIFRSVRFGASSAHGRANMLRFNFFEQAGAFSRDEATGRYRVEREKMAQAVTDLSRKILTLQGDGDYDGVVKLMNEQGNVGPALQADLDRLSQAGIPVDVVYEQGMSVLR